MNAGFHLNQYLNNWASHVSGLGPTFMKNWSWWSSPPSGSRNAWTRIINVNGAIRLGNFGIFSARSKWFPVAISDHGRNLVISLWPGDKATINGLPGLPMSWSPTLLSGSGPSHYHLFPGLEKQLKGRHFSSDAEVIAAAETWLDGQTSEFFYFVWLAKVGATS